MIDINLLRKEPEKYRKATENKGVNPQLVDNVLKLDQERRNLLKQVEELRAERNKLTESIKYQVVSLPAGKAGIKENPKAKEEIEKLKQQAQEIKKKLDDVEPRLTKVEKDYQELLLRIPNPALPDVKIGKGEQDNEVVKQWGEPSKFDFTPKDHVELGEALDILDFKRGAKVAGADFYFLKNDGALFELALVQYGLDFLKQKGFMPIITPDLAHAKYYLGTGFAPKGPERQTYTISDSDLGLIATAEVTLAGLHADEVLAKDKLPLSYAGYSHCFRVESGAYGKYSRGLYRVHQFTKVEMFVYSLPETSEEMHEKLLSLEEEFWQSLKIPYRVVKMCTGDLGAQAAKKYDLEAWMPGRNDWGEITSTSNTTDYQARRLNIKYRDGEKTNFVHTLNGTLVATSRAIIAILENYQGKDGSVRVPEVLQKYLNKKILNGRK